MSSTPNSKSSEERIFTIRGIPADLHVKWSMAKIVTSKTMEQIAIEAIEKEVKLILDEYGKLVGLKTTEEIEEKVAVNLPVPINANVEEDDPVNIAGNESVENKE